MDAGSIGGAKNARTKLSWVPTTTNDSRLSYYTTYLKMGLDRWLIRFPRTDFTIHTPIHFCDSAFRTQMGLKNFLARFLGVEDDYPEYKSFGRRMDFSTILNAGKLRLKTESRKQCYFVTSLLQLYIQLHHQHETPMHASLPSAKDKIQPAYQSCI